MDIKSTLIKFFKLDNLFSHLSGYVDTQVALVKLEIREEVSRLLARGLMVAVAMFLVFLFLAFFSVGLAQYLNTFFANSFVGYWLVAAFYGLPCTIFLTFRRGISKKIEHRLNEMIRHKEDHEA
ncbi:MAG: phage holin family protein [Cytophagales bacterium]